MPRNLRRLLVVTFARQPTSPFHADHQGRHSLERHDEALRSLFEILTQGIQVCGSKSCGVLQLDVGGPAGLGEETPACGFKQLVDLDASCCFLHCPGSECSCARAFRVQKSAIVMYSNILLSTMSKSAGSLRSNARAYGPSLFHARFLPADAEWETCLMEELD